MTTNKVNFAPLRVLTTGLPNTCSQATSLINKMAAQNFQKPTEISFEINLKETFLGKRRLRYMYHYEPNIVSTNPDKNNKCIPLFLGCDVVDECSHSSANLPRFHAKHARRGLATKVNFQSGVRIVGIHGTARGVWFYSVQGLFKIAFEYYTREDQQSCLVKLRDVWERQIFDPVLMSEMNVIFKNSGAESVCGLTLMSAKESVSSTTDATVETFNVDEFVNHVNAAIDSYTNDSSTSESHVTLMKIYLSHMNQKSDFNCFAFRTINMINACLGILPELSKQLESSEVSEHVPTSVNNPTSSDSFSSPKPSDKSNENCASKQDLLTFPKEAILTHVADFLGEEFLYYHDKISEKVTLFKQRNMSKIGNLPSAKALIDKVFPWFMQVFFCRWMRVALNSDTTIVGEDMSQENRRNLYPIIQLILELANESLVSGVAHVLVSQLLQSDSVQ
jgi:hypothetical protein